MKLTAADRWYSRCVRERSNWTCELCGTEYPDGRAKGACQGLDCSHYVSRGNWSVRFDSSNAFAHCVSCHFRFSGDAQLQIDEYKRVFGQGQHERLRERKNDTSLGRSNRKEVKEIAKHYKKEYELMRSARAKGAAGRLEFTSY